MEPIANMGYDLYTDRFYTSPILALELAAMKTTLTGTAMANRKEMPQAVLVYRLSGNKHLPEMVHEYNQHMMGVDRMDQMMAYYAFQRKSIKWWRKVFFSSSRKMSLKEFRRELAVQLCRGVVQEDSLGYQRMDQSVERLRGRHFPDQGRKRRDCRVCSDRCSLRLS
jgi:hypothetical protein